MEQKILRQTWSSESKTAISEGRKMHTPRELAWELCGAIKESNVSNPKKTGKANTQTLIIPCESSRMHIHVDFWCCICLADSSRVGAEGNDSSTCAAQQYRRVVSGHTLVPRTQQIRATRHVLVAVLERFPWQHPGSSRTNFSPSSPSRLLVRLRISCTALSLQNCRNSGFIMR